ncbi:MAG: tryptophan-rich sensory protein [Lachnospiraceae bacterium]|nr:tryptophan-rich sensory protein [Lachnospiraceae bacterium]
MESRKKIESFLISVMIPLFIGFLAGALTSNSQELYKMMEKPSFSPPAILFPIVWTILYILMGISYYLVIQSDSDLKDKAVKVYFTQLLLNFFWSIIFFNLQNYLAAFIWILLLIAAVIAMIVVFCRIKKIAGCLQIPYLLWLLFAAVLNFAVYRLNR